MKVFGDVMLALCAGALFTMAFFTLGPMAETRWFPVYGKFKLTSVERIPPNNSLIHAEFTKNRDCVPLGAAWYNAPVSREIDSMRQLEWIPRRRVGETPVPSLPVGRQESVPFELSASPEEVTSTVFAEVFSRCHPFWTTRSMIFP